jgi:hypothetical protein
MRRLFIVTLALCMLTLSASAWAGPGSHRQPQARYSQHHKGHPLHVQGMAVRGHRFPRHAAHAPRACAWNHRHVHGHVHRHGQRFAGCSAPARFHRPVPVHKRYVNRSQVREFTIRVRTMD